MCVCVCGSYVFVGVRFRIQIQMQNILRTCVSLFVCVLSALVSVRLRTRAIPARVCPGGTVLLYMPLLAAIAVKAAGATSLPTEELCGPKIVVRITLSRCHRVVVDSCPREITL